MNSCEGFWSCITPDAVVQSGGTIIGAFLGTFLAAHIATRSLRREKQEEVTKTYIQNISNLNYITSYFNEFVKGKYSEAMRLNLKHCESRRASYVESMKDVHVPLHLVKYFTNMNLSLRQLFNQQIIHEMFEGTEQFNEEDSLKNAKELLITFKKNRGKLEEKLKINNFI